ncbi:MAG: UDP-N-acetylmuramate:L-alanyl-gamma-D-glutamyl-meso-diaminopimelate ligase [Gammaproteobacteria bacterium]|nr:UDP-N-acetylmuramate:L-alanyl-gamma-D-glutamyl-meso-diaminopimelate ligase [Gammaproteobacteria bacterium]
MHLFIAGICGTFMAGLALLARERGFRVRGCDANVYPPMSDQLRAAGIEVLQSYSPVHLDERPDVVIIGNALSRGNPLVEHVLDAGIAYTSGPQWLFEHVLADRHVIAVSGTHGKTTTSSMLAWALQHGDSGVPGFLIGGVPADFGVSARLGDSRYFVIEADEYDTAFFDKRSKFVHYRPRTLIINNIEYDHADIFPDLESIQRQFHHLVRTVPASGLIVYPATDPAVATVLKMGSWSQTRSLGVYPDAGDWHARATQPDGSEFEIGGRSWGFTLPVSWQHTGRHNLGNALAATAAASALGVKPEGIVEALSTFRGVKRRLERLAEMHGVTVYDDFAHHPTAIETTLAGLRAGSRPGRIIAVIEPRSNTMRLGSHLERLSQCTRDADFVYWYQPAAVSWNMQAVAAESSVASVVCDSIEAIIEALLAGRREGDRIVIMSNGGFEGIHQRLLAALQSL